MSKQSQQQNEQKLSTTANLTMRQSAKDGISDLRVYQVFVLRAKRKKQGGYTRKLEISIKIKGRRASISSRLNLPHKARPRNTRRPGDVERRGRIIQTHVAQKITHCNMRLNSPNPSYHPSTYLCLPPPLPLSTPVHSPTHRSM